MFKSQLVLGSVPCAALPKSRMLIGAWELAYPFNQYEKIREHAFSPHMPQLHGAFQDAALEKGGLLTSQHVAWQKVITCQASGAERWDAGSYQCM